MADTTDRREDGFELAGSFYRWSVSDVGKDLMLIDRFTGMPVSGFFEALEDEDARGRGPIMLAMIATSIRANHPDWSVERITRLVQATSLGDIEFIEADAEAQPVPPAGGGETPPETSNGQPEGSSSSSIQLVS